MVQMRYLLNYFRSSLPDDIFIVSNIANKCKQKVTEHLEYPLTDCEDMLSIRLVSLVYDCH
jgi:hypothetical protein